MQNIKLITEKYIVKVLQGENVEEINSLFIKSTDYFQKIFDRNPNIRDASTLFTTVPKGKVPEDKLVLGIYTKNNKLIGLLDLVQNYPEQNAWFLGLLLIDPEERNRKIGTEILLALIKKSEELNITKINVSVEEHNTQAIKFWEKMGFVEYDKLKKGLKNFIYFTYLL